VAWPGSSCGVRCVGCLHKTFARPTSTAAMRCICGHGLSAEFALLSHGSDFAFDSQARARLASAISVFPLSHPWFIGNCLVVFFASTNNSSALRRRVVTGWRAGTIQSNDSGASILLKSIGITKTGCHPSD